MFIESNKNFIEELEKLRKQLKQEQLLKAQAVNKLAEIMNRKDNTTKGKSKVSSADLRRKEKECRKLQQELTQVCRKSTKLYIVFSFCIMFCLYWYKNDVIRSKIEMYNMFCIKKEHYKFLICDLK